MELIVTISTIVFLCIIIYQDFKDRKISLVFLILIFGSSLFISYRGIAITELFQRIILNSILSFFILYSGTHIVKLSKPGLSRSDIIGPGDFLFLISISPMFPFVAFLVFLNFSLITILLITLLVQFIIKKKNNTIPLAGGLAIGICVFFIMKIFFDVNISEQLNSFLLASYE